MQDIVIVGGSIAGVTAAKTLRKLGFEGNIRVVDQDREAPYRRPEVSKTFLAAPAGVSKLGLSEDLGVETIHDRVVGVDLDGQVLQLTNGSLSYDGLVIASGSRAREVPAWSDVAGLYTLRTVADSDRMRDDFLAAESVTIVGAGFIGLEVAAKAAELGKQVRVLEAAEVPLDRVADQAFGRHLQGSLERRGVRFTCSSAVSEVKGGADGGVEVHLSDGEVLHSDLAVLAIGSVPEIDWLADTGLDTSNGVMCDENCAVEGVENVVAAGDVANWPHPLFGTRIRVEHWTNAMEQGAWAAARLLGQHVPGGFRSVPYFWSNQADLKVEAVGSTIGCDDFRVLLDDGDRIVGAYARDGVLTAVAGVGATAIVIKAKALIAEQASLDDPRLQELVAK